MDVGAGTPQDHHDLTAPREVWGVSGCLPMYRTSAIARASESGELFDGSYRSYKEDVDLAYRLQALGMSAVVIPEARAYHRRSVGVGVHRPRSAEAVYHSYRNHLWLLAAHLDTRSLMGSRAGVIPYELMKALVWCVRHPAFFAQTIRETIAAWPRLMRKRAFVRMLNHARPPRETFIPPDVDLAVVMVSHNDLNDACLASLAAARAAAPELRFEVIAVYNASTTYEANVVVTAHLPD
ncbi:MAG: hypothetical protein Q8R16_03695, partial [bacterium]|nr:hypothetical protein [bacterium]